MRDLVATIIKCHSERKPMRATDVKQYVMRKWGKDISTNTLHHMLKKNKDVKSVPAKPMEDKRVMVGINVIRDYFDVLGQTVSGTPAAFVFNMDEMGHQVWADAQDTVCFVPASETASVVYFPVSRTGKRITLIACIAADGTYIRPALILARKTYENEIRRAGFTKRILDIYHQINSFIDGPIFDDWFSDSFCPDLQRRRETYQYFGPAYLILDNCTSHRGPLFQRLCIENGVQPIFLPHSSNQLQPLDLCVFGVTKRRIQRANDIEFVNLQSKHIVDIVNAFQEAATSWKIIQSFRNGGIIVVDDPIDEDLYCVVEPGEARCIFHDTDIPLPERIEDDPNIEAFLENLQ
jgi:hypothetical protein